MSPIKVEYSSDPRTLKVRHYQEHLRTLREELGYTQREMAEMIGVPRSTLAHWEAGHNPPHPKRIMLLLQEHGIPSYSVQQPRQPWDAGTVLRTYEDVGEEAPPF